ncbi:MAG: hypothetical protein JO372_10285 [Solirubrobacterales bacterium]|nr:hypothetical protein [Solirubrobacterales bacterium]
MRRACIDIGSNTTRLLVADCDLEGLREIHQERAFTHIGHGLLADGSIAPAKISEVVEVITRQLERAGELGAEDIHGVATAAIRRSRNGTMLVDAIRRGCGLRVEVLSPQEEARLAFVGAARTLDHVPAGQLGVVDVGGGSSELAVGTAPDTVTWCASLAVGSGDLASSCLHSDPPSSRQLSQARAEVAQALGGLEAPHPDEALAVGGSAASLRVLAGPVLDREALRESLALLASDRAEQLAHRFGLAVDRVRLLPAALLILEATSELLGAALQIACGGIREAVLLEAAR